MGDYMIKMMVSSWIKITEKDYQNLIGKNGLVLLQSLGRTINTNSISQIMPYKDYLIDKQEERKNQKEGILHDGTHVIRHFGQWFKLEGDYDDRGNPLTRFDPEMYPEVARDCVPSKQEFHQKYAHLPTNRERLAAILEGNQPLRIGQSTQPQPLSKLLNEKLLPEK